MSSTTSVAVPSPTAPPRPGPPPDGDVNRGHVILIVTAVTTSLALIVVGLRMFVRLTIVRGVGWDDYTILAASALAILVFGFEIAAVSYGFGRHSYYLPPADAITASKWSRSAIPPNLASSLLARVSLCLFLLRIVEGRRGYTIFLWCVIGISTATTISTILISLLGCRPIEKLWNKEAPGSCAPPRVTLILGIAQASAAVLGDWLVALFPILLLKNLNMARKTKAALIILMGLGVFVGIAVIVKAQQLYTLGTRIDGTWDTVSLVCLSIVEQNTAILAVSVPPCRPLVRRFFGMGSSDEKYQGHHRYGYRPNGHQLGDLGGLGAVCRAGRIPGPSIPDLVSSVSAGKPRADDGHGSESSLVHEGPDGVITKTVSVSLHSHQANVDDSGEVDSASLRKAGRDRSWYRADNSGGND